LARADRARDPLSMAPNKAPKAALPATPRAPRVARASTSKPTHRCVVCGYEPPAGTTLVPVSIARRTRRACAFHAIVADRTAPATLAEFRRVCAAHDRRGRSSDERRAGEDRRAFWRPTPDRRAEPTELGRRRADDVSGA
jgi:hypothetical protein